MSVGEELKNLKASRFLKILTFVVGLGLMMLGFNVFLLFTIIDILDFILSAYYLIFGVLICISALPFDCLLTKVSFLKYFFGKAVFLCFLGTITFDSTDLFHLIVSIACFVSAALYLVLAMGFRDCLNPADEEEIEQPQGGFRPASYGAMEDQKPLKS